MTHENVKLFAVNTTIFGLSFTSIESSMRVFLLGLSILYTSIMIIKILTKKKEDENK